jgi:uncharacterized protein (DUF1499 family)
MSSQDTPRPISRWPLICGWLALLALAFTLILLAYTGPAYRAGWIDLRLAIFSLLRWTAYGAIACIALGALALVWNLLRGSRLMAGAALVVMLVGAGLTFNFLQWQATGRGVPPIHDISTDTRNPPEFVDILPLRANAPNPPEYAGAETAALQQEAYPDLQPIRLQADRDAVYVAALDVVRSTGWALVSQVPAEGRIEATDTTRYFGFKDDVVIRIVEDNGETVVDVRSKSRLGRSDVGTNARRIRSFREKLLERV